MRVTRRSSFQIATLLGAAAFSPPLAFAQDTTGRDAAGNDESADPHEGAGRRKEPVTAGGGRLPADSSFSFSFDATGRSLPIKATAGAIKLTNSSGTPLAEIGTISYVLDGADLAKRPVTFAINGGPGASSAWLHLGAIGPWRLPMQGLAPSSRPALVDNAESWLAFTDLVFIDPPDTGYSRIVGGDEVKKSLFSVNGDIDGLAGVIRRWLIANTRLASPKFIVGESYGGFRGPRLAKILAGEGGVGVGGLILLSPVLDFGQFFGGGAGPFPSLTRLPSYAAVAREKNGPVTREDLADVEAYAAGDYLRDWFKGPRDHAAVARIEAKVAELTGLDPALVTRLGGIVGQEDFLNESARSRGQVRAFYDATIEAYDPFPDDFTRRALDPVLPGFEPAFTSAIVDVYEKKFGWRLEQRYELINEEVNASWNWGSKPNPAESITALRQMLALDPNFRVVVAQGLTDLQTPYFGTQLELNQIPDFGPPGRLTLNVYPGGHMLYSRDDSRKALRDDARRLIEGQ
jgi:carboxypeptidase C (cathepsin A)